MNAVSAEDMNAFFEELQELHRNFNGDEQLDEGVLLGEALYLAIRRNRIGIVQRILETENVDVNATDDSGNTLLIKAVEAGHCAMATFLLDTGADVAISNIGGAAALHFAGHSEMAQLLIEHGADVNALDDEGQTPLHACACVTYEESEQQIELIRVLVANGANIMAVDGGEHHTPLHFLAEGSAGVEVFQYYLGLLEMPEAVMKALLSKDKTGLLPFHLVNDVGTASLLIQSLMNDGTPSKVFPPTICREMMLARDEDKKTSLDITRDFFGRNIENEVTQELIVFLESFTEESVVVPSATAQGPMKIPLNPRYNVFQRSIAKGFLMSVVGVPKLLASGDEATELPRDVKYVILSFLALTDIMVV